VDEHAGDGRFLFHAGGKFVAPSIAEIIHVKRAKKHFDAGPQNVVCQAVQSPKIFHQFVGSQPRIERGGGGKKADAGAHLLGIGNDVEAIDSGRSRAGPEQGGKDAQTGRLTRAIATQQAEDFARLTTEIDAIDGGDFPALFVMEDFGQLPGLDHG
jgi:hypothetical protein